VVIWEDYDMNIQALDYLFSYFRLILLRHSLRTKDVRTTIYWGLYSIRPQQLAWIWMLMKSLLMLTPHPLRMATEEATLESVLEILHHQGLRGKKGKMCRNSFLQPWSLWRSRARVGLISIIKSKKDLRILSNNKWGAATLHLTLARLKVAWLLCQNWIHLSQAPLI
jgi:hypothetical protein